MDRRHFLFSVAASATYVAFSRNELRAQGLDFQQIFSKIEADPTAAEDARAYKDFAMENNGAACIPVTIDGSTTCIVSAARQPPRISPSNLSISGDSKKFIMFYEVTGEGNYNKKLKSPIWPGEDSGVTIGIGYDLGYASQADLQGEWGNYVHPFIIKRLAVACGKRGKDAQNILTDLKNVHIEWEDAYKQFTEKLLPVFVALTETFCDNLEDIHEDCRGALTSLVFNRGTALELKNDPLDSRREMREIKDLMKKKQYSGIPQKFLDMQRLWKGNSKVRGVVDRRAGEAALFERGLRS